MIRKPYLDVLCIIFALLITLPVSAMSFSVGNLQYNTIGDGNSVEVNGYKNQPTDIIIPSTVNYAGKNYIVEGIGSSAFYGCYTLTSVTLGDNINTIGYQAFKGCIAFTDIHTSADNATFQSLDGLLYSKDLKTLVLYPQGRTDETINVKEGVEAIGQNVFFDNKTIKSVLLPASLKSIGYQAFGGCTNLGNMVLPPLVTTLGASSFRNCESMKSISIEGTLSEIGNEAFALSGLESIVLNTSMTSIPQRLFYNCMHLTSVVIPATVISLGYYSFAHCFALEAFDFSSNLQEIGAGCFYGDTSLKQADLSSTRLTSIESDVFYGCTSMTSISLPANLQSIGSNAFSGCAQITQLDIPSGVKSLGDGAFSNMGLTSISLPESITHLSNYLLAGNKSLQSFTIPACIESIGIGVFQGCSSIEEMAIPERFTIIPDWLFADCSNLKKVSLPSRTTTIGNYVFQGCSNLESFDIPQSVSTIGGHCFENCVSLEELTIPAGIKELPNRMCFGCSALRKVTFGLNYIWQTGSNTVASLQTGEMGQDAFANCTSLEEIHVLDIIAPWGIDRAFSGVNLKSVSLFVPVEAIPSYESEWSGAFKECIEEESSKGLVFIAQGYTCARFPDERNKVCLISSPYWRDFRYEGDVVVPESIIYADEELTIAGMLGYSNGMFNNLTSIVFPKTIEIIGGENGANWNYDMHLFSYCTKLKSITVADDCENYFSHQGVLYEKKDSALLYVPISLTDKDTLVTRYEIPSGVKEIVSFNVSYDKSNIKVLSIPSSMKNIRQDAFSNTFIDTVYIYATTPPGRPHMRDDGYGGFGTLYVPYKCKSVYQEAYSTDANNTPSWPAISNIIEMPNYEPTTVIARSYIRKYGDENPVFEYEVTQGEIDGEPELICEATTSSPIGIYNILVHRGSETNTNITYIAGTLTIEPAALIVSAGNYTKRQYDPMPTFTLSYAGFKNEEDESILNATPFITCEATEDSTPGEYPIQIAGAVAENYNISYVPGVLIVTEPASYILKYLIDNVEYKSYTVRYRDVITPEAEPTKEGYTFSGWSEIPTTMPDHDVTVTGTFAINSYMLTYMIDDIVYKETAYEYGTAISPEPVPEGDFISFEWIGLPEIMPAHDVVVHAAYMSGIVEMMMANSKYVQIYSPNGKLLSKLQKGINIIRLKDGTTRKIIVE